MRKLVAIVMLLVGCRSRHTHPSVYEDDATLPAFVRPEMLIEVDSARLAAFGLTLQDVQSALLAEHMAVTPGAPGSFIVKTTSSPSDVLAIVVIKFRDGSPIRLADLARASMREK